MPFYDQFGAAVTEGELHFSGWQEAVTQESPADILEAREFEVARERAGKASVGLELARELGDAYCIRLFSRVLKESAGVLSEDDEAEARWLSLGDALGQDETAQEQETRLRHFRIFLRYVAQGAEKRDLKSLARNVLAIARRVMPELVGGISQVESAALTGEDKQAAQAREKRLVETPQKRAGISGYRGYGKTADEKGRANMAAAARGNTHRATAAKNAKAGPKKAKAAQVKAAGRKTKPKAAKGAQDRKGAFVIKSTQTGAAMEAATIREARDLWLLGGLRAGGRMGSALNTGLILEGGRIIARVEYDGAVIGLQGEKIA